MVLKPRSSVGNIRALIYKRYTQIKTAVSSNCLYRTADGKFWRFDGNFFEYVGDIGGKKIVNISANDKVQYDGLVYVYGEGAWAEDSTATSGIQGFNNRIGTYQTNEYYFSGSFDFMIKGGIESADTQFIKGNIVPLRSFNIRYFDDNANLDHDDLLVIDGHLYSVESLSQDRKMMPKPFIVYFATLNNIL